jgi:glycosyltransferase involved in cell wall biosynthesis
MLGPRDEFRIRAYDTLLTQHAYKGARLAFYLTNTEKRELSALGWIVQLRALYNAVDPIADEAAVRSAEPLRIVTISRIHHRKYIGDLVEAVAIAKSHGLDCRLEIYGPDEGDLAAVRNAIHDHDVDDCVHYGGPLQYDQVPSELNANDVFVLPSRREPFPNALLEALASGRPTLSTTECGLAPHIQNFKAGVVVKPGPHNLALGILEIAGFSSEEWHTMGSNAIALCRAKFSLAYLSEELASAYESILSE